MTASDGKKIVHIHIGKQNYKTSLTAGDHELTADEPESVGGQDLGPDPYDYLLMSLGSCTAITLRMYIERKQWEIENVYVELRHYKDHAEDCEDCDEKAAKIDIVEEEVIIDGDVTDEQLDKLLSIAHKCPVYRTLKGAIQTKTSISRH
jgi:putative redox protein